MSDEQHEPLNTRCPVCTGAVIAKYEDAGAGLVTKYESTITPQAIALALDNEGVTRKVHQLLNNELRLAIVGVLLEGNPGSDGYFTIKDVEDEAEAGLRAMDVAREIKARNRHEEAAHFRGLSERHQRRAIRITALLPEAEQQLIKQRVHGGPVGNNTPAHIKIITQ
jgi:hypothetical protein